MRGSPQPGRYPNGALALPRVGSSQRIKRAAQLGGAENGRKIVVTANEKAELVFTVEKPTNLSVIVEKSRGGNILPNPSFEEVDEGGNVPGWKGKTGNAMHPTMQWGHEEIPWDGLKFDLKELPVKAVAQWDE